MKSLLYDVKTLCTHSEPISPRRGREINVYFHLIHDFSRVVVPLSLA